MRALSVGLACVLSFLASSARAQSAEAAPEPAPSTAGAPTPTPAQAEAMERFAEAEALFERGDHAAALSEMERIYELLEGSANQYVVLYNLGRVYEQLFQYSRAIELYQRYLAESPEGARDRADAQAGLQALERLLGTLVIRTNATAVHVWIGDTDVGTAPGEIRISAGHHALELRAAGFESVRREIDVAPRTRVELDVPMTALSDYHGIDSAVFIATTSATAATLLAGVSVGVAALVMSNDAGACLDRVGCSIDIVGTRQTLRDYALTADVLYGIAGALAVTSVVVAFLTDWGGRTESAAVSARLGLTPGGLVVDGTF